MLPLFREPCGTVRRCRGCVIVVQRQRRFEHLVLNLGISPADRRHPGGVAARRGGPQQGAFPRTTTVLLLTSRPAEAGWLLTPGRPPSSSVPAGRHLRSSVRRDERYRTEPTVRARSSGENPSHACRSKWSLLGASRCDPPERSSRAAHAAHTERTIEELTVTGGLMSLRLLRQNAVGTRLESTAARRFAGRSLDLRASSGSQVGSAGSVATRGG